ncbi:MAG: type IV pilus assembly protein PilP [Candidatus Azotimanducaceae bacterium]|jgi:type IV pilus assembly protein PilP
MISPLFKSTILKRLMLLTIVSLISACSETGDYEDIKKFMSDVKEKPAGSIAPLPEFEPYQPFTYGAANRRSPFEPPVPIPVRSELQRKNIGVKPPQDHVKQYLERFNLAALQMVGTMKQEDSTWALIEDNTGGVHRVQVGDFMGASWGKIESINESRVDITEIVTDGASGWLRRPRSIELKAKPE